MKSISRKNLNLFGFLTILLILGQSSFLFGAKIYHMKENDTLWDLSNRYYGDPRLYPIFLEVNDIDNPRAIPTGKEIYIPTIDEMNKISKETDPTRRKALIRSSIGEKNSPQIPQNPPPNFNNPKDDSSPQTPLSPHNVSFGNALKGPKTPSTPLKKVGKSR